MLRDFFWYSIIFNNKPNSADPASNIPKNPIVFIVASTDSVNLAQVNPPKKYEKNIVTTTPIAAASVGVAIPK